MSFLKEIVKSKKEEVKYLKKSLKNIEKDIKKGEKNYFLNSITKDRINVIAEIKKASPSSGILNKSIDPIKLAREYYESGANAISVVTDKKFFHGEINLVKEVKANFNIPVLKKDFIIDESQVIEARYYNADAILLIAKILSLSEIKKFTKLSNELGMDVIIEVHDEEDIKKAVKTDNPIIGINNRNLETFELDINNSIRLSSKIPEGIIKISESGISSIKDICLLKEIGFKTFLIGTYLVKHTKPGDALREIKAC